MERTESNDGRNRLVRSALALVLAGVAIVSLREGKRLRGTLAGVGALALGYDATKSDEPKQHFELDATEEEQAEQEEDVDLRCAICGDPIRPGQARGPDENDDIVHEACLGPGEQ